MSIDYLAQKQALFADLIARLVGEFQTLVAQQRATHAGATHEEAKPENDKDTRALEQSYLARGQAKRVAAVEQEVSRLRALWPRAHDTSSPIALGALLVTEEDGRPARVLLLAPAGAGQVLPSALGDVHVITPQSPLGRVLIGAFEGDDVEVRGPNGLRVVSVLEVH